MRTEPGATGAKTDRQQRQNANRCSQKRHSHQLLTELLTSGPDRLAAVQQKSRRANLSIFSNLRYQDRRSAGDAAAAACAKLRARPEMTVTATRPFIQIGAVFPRARVGPAAFDRRRIGCSATPPGVEPQGGHATDQTSHGCMMKPIGCLLYTSPSPRDKRQSRMPSSA